MREYPGDLPTEPQRALITFREFWPRVNAAARRSSGALRSKDPIPSLSAATLATGPPTALLDSTESTDDQSCLAGAR
jgi:hypothetical protein